MRVLTAVLLALHFTAPATMAADADGATIYKRCAVCHLPDRAGVPGTFPPLDEHIPAMAESEAGREYLVAAVSRGVAGAMEIDGVTYRGMMPPQSTLANDQLAAVLNFLIEGGGAQAFTLDEVARLRVKHARTPPHQVRALRNAVSGPAETAGP